MKKRFIIVAIVIAIAIISISIYFITTQKLFTSTKKVEDNSLEERQSQGKYSLIDMNNTDNVKIVGDVKENNSTVLLTEKTLLGLKISNIRLAAENGLTNFTADVENISGEDFTERTIFIVFKNEDGSEYARLESYLPDIKIGGTSKIDASITNDLSNAYDFVIE